MAIVDLDRRVRRLEPKGRWSDPAPLSTYRYAPAYVLLGDPGAGKSTAFDREQTATPRSEPVTARDFRAYGDALSAQTETLFIDGLDEARAGGGDPWGSFDQIRRRLRQLTPKRVRLSCRELDWLGDNDRTNLSKVVPGGEVIVLRLEPLNADEQRSIIGADSRIADPNDFILEAADRGVEGLLTNAQTLALLVRVVAENEAFPDGRTETFEEACRLLAREPNDDHRIAAPLPEPETLVETAGYMCAVSLLSGAAGFSVPSARESDGFVPTSQFGASADSAERAAHTRLFTTVGGGLFVPAHANIAAFLAAQHLARLVDGQMPGGRILALLSGNDGFPPTPLRSLVAWLAVTSSTVRRTLIERDPVAVLMYGDVRKFKAEERAFLLEKIAEDPSRLYEGLWPDSALAGLAGADMDATLRSVLADPDRSDPTQKVVEIVTKALRQAPANQALTDMLLAVWRDKTRWFRVRKPALDAWIHSLANEPTRSDRLCVVLGQIQDGTIEDYGGELLGTLLRELYPGAIEPGALWQYFRIPMEPLLGRFHRFWDELPDTCPEEDLPAHLDYLAASEDTVRPSPDLPRPSDLPVRFLARAVETRGERLEAPRLTTWLRVGLDEWGMLRPEGFEGEKACGRVCEWLKARPAAQKAVIRCALRSPEFRELEIVEYFVNELLYRSDLPDDIGAWHLDEAVTAENTDLTKKHLIAFWRHLEQHPADVDATLARAHDRLVGKPDALRLLDGFRPSPPPEWLLEHRARLQQARAQLVQPDQGLLQAVRSEEQQLRENRASLGLLLALAQTHFEGRRIRGPSSGARLLEALGGDERLANLALDGIRRTIEREDLPSVGQLIRLQDPNQVSAVVWPVLVGLNDWPPDAVVELAEDRLRVALACRLLQLGLAQEVPWYQRCVRERPDLVAEVLVRVGRALLGSGETSFPDLHQFPRDDDHSEVAHRATVRLLRAFPARAPKSQFALLDVLLRSGLRHLVSDSGDRASLRSVIESKVRQKSTTRTARVRWLAAGLVLEPGRFLAELADEVRGSEARLRSLADFFTPFVLEGHEGLAPKATEFLIRALGRDGDPLIPDLVVRHSDGISLVLPRLIAQLAQHPSQTATEVLAALATDESLSAWRRTIEEARDTQRVVRRDATYTPPASSDVIATLRDGPPASAADLRELVVDRLHRIKAELKATGADLWQFFWNQDPNGKRKNPKPEHPCRDALLTLLRTKLPPGCAAELETVHAGKKRADIGISYGPFKVPLEVKKNSNSEVWGGVRNQLIPRYTNDPATEGLGIYLVLWFGPEGTAGVPTARKPTTPDEMRDRLLADLTSEERRRAAVLVMDVTPPSQ